MTSSGPSGSRRRGPRSCHSWLRALALSFLLFPPGARSQELPNIPALESEYLAARREYEAAFFALEALESRYNQALEEWSEARTSGDERQINQIFTTVQQMGLEVGNQERRVQEKADELEGARSRLLEALGRRLEDLIDQVEEAADPQEARQLAAILDDANRRYLELRAEEPPETVLEPMQEVTINPGDTPRDILLKAESLDFKADRYEARLAEVARRLEELREDQRRARDVSDFLAGLERYDDTRLPVVSPGNRPVDPDPEQLPPGSDTLGVEARPLTLEERIQRLEALEEDLAQRVEEIRAKAQRFRDHAGGGGR